MLKALMLAAALALATPATVAAQTSPSSVADTFFTTLKSGDPAKAYHDLWAGTQMDKKQADVENLINQTGAIMKFYGRVLGWELMTERTYTPSLIERIYVLRTENGPVFYRMLFYRGETRWMVANLYFGDRFNEFK